MNVLQYISRTHGIEVIFHPILGDNHRYAMLGRLKQAKTERYRHFFRHFEQSPEVFVHAPGATPEAALAHERAWCDAALPLLLTVALFWWTIDFINGFVGPSSRIGQAVSSLGLGVSGSEIVGYAIGVGVDVNGRPVNDQRDLALGGLPTFTALAGRGADAARALSGRILVAPEIDYVERAGLDQRVAISSRWPSGSLT